MGRRRLSGLRIVMHPLPRDEEFDSGSMRFGATSELLQLLNSCNSWFLNFIKVRTCALTPTVRHCYVLFSGAVNRPSG